MKRKNWKTWAILAFSPVLLFSCSTTAHIEKDESVSFENYKTFAWLHGDKGKFDNQSDLIESRVREAVTSELQKAGWRQVKTKPDVILDYDLLVERASKERSDAKYSEPYTRLIYNPYTRKYATIYYPSQFLGYDSYEQLIKEGTVTIAMIDTKTDKIVWQGWTTEEVNNRNLTSKEIQNAVRSIFKKFEVAKN